MTKTLGVYSYVLYGKAFDIPYLPMLYSVKDIADEIVMVTDPRFKDGTWEHLLELSKQISQLRVYNRELDLNNPGIDGATKAMARGHCDSDVLLQMDSDECLQPQHGVVIRSTVQNWPTGVAIIGTGVVNFFGGDWFKMEAAGWYKERLSINDANITHGIPKAHRVPRGQYYGGDGDTDGAGYIDKAGNSINATKWLCDREEKNMIKDMKSPDSIWIPHYSWYNIFRKWDMKLIWHYFWGILRGDYNCVEEYTINPDGNAVDIWNPVRHDPKDQLGAIRDEFKNAKKMKRAKNFPHPPVMTDWIKRQSLYTPKGLFRREFKQNI